MTEKGSIQREDVSEMLTHITPYSIHIGTEITSFETSSVVNDVKKSLHNNEKQMRETSLLLEFPEGEPGMVVLIGKRCPVFCYTPKSVNYFRSSFL